MNYHKAHEKTFQRNIIEGLEKQGWLVGNSAQYNRETALYEEDLIGYFQDAWPERWERLVQNHPNPEEFLIQQTARYLQRRRSEEHTSELQSRGHLVCRLLREKKKT